MDFYKGYPRYNCFDNALKKSKNKLCYNGNVFDRQDYLKIEDLYSGINSVMLARGAVANPALFREIKGGAPLGTDELVAFTKALKDSYYELFGNDTYTIHKLKEIWLYMMWNYPEEKKILKAIKKSQKLSEFMTAVESLPEI
jgi:tRNA-dihydrouridine synthase